MIEIKNLVKRYGTNLAVDNLSLSIESGMIYGFLGPNGAGKSTTMNILTGYIGATSGEVIIDGHNILEEPEEAKKCIGYLPELPPLYQEMTVYEYLKFVAELKKIQKNGREEHILEVMKLTKITDVGNKLIRKLSKGYKQRVGMAQAILGYPPVIILDEPTVGLDPKQIIEVRELIKNLGKKHTVILSSHIMQEVSAVCDYIFIIDKGRLIASDYIENLSEKSNTNNILTIVAQGNVTDIIEVLEDFENINEFNVNSREDDSNLCDLVIETDKSVDLRTDLFFKFAEKRVAVLESNLKEKSLEDIFIELTSDNEADEVLSGETETVEKEDNFDDSDL